MIARTTDMTPELSVVVPLYNEEESLRPLYRAITNAVAPLGISYEIVFVDDGSRDATVQVADEIARSDARVCLGSSVVTMDRLRRWRPALRRPVAR